MKYIGIALIVIIFSGQSEAQKTQFFETIELELSHQSAIDGYLLYAPREADSGKKYPIIMFLHGGGLVGGSIEQVGDYDLPLIIKTDTVATAEVRSILRDSFIVICPHLTEGAFDDRQFYDQEDVIAQIIADVQMKYNVDTDRIFLTGLSRGGHGTYGLAAKLPQVFTAIVPVSGGIHGVDDFDALKNMPMWIVHNTGDQLVNHNNALKAVENIEERRDDTFLAIHEEKPSIDKISGHQRIFSSIEKESHDAWTSLYHHSAMYHWLLQQGKH